jgi:hypothetical protein
MRYYVLFFYRFVRLNVRARDRIAARRCPLTADAFRCDARADRSQITVLACARVDKELQPRVVLRDVVEAKRRAIVAVEW